MSMRLFISINVPHRLHRYCRQLQGQFPDLKTTREFHLTVQFLGGDIESAEPIIEALKTVRFTPFEMEMGDAVPFPNAFRPRGVWIECTSGAPLEKLTSDIRHVMGGLGFSADKPFKAHITLGRYKRQPTRLPKTARGKAHSFTVDQFHLMESILTPNGPIYKELASFPK